MTPPKIYSWYTTETPYASLAPVVAGDCARLGIDHEIIPVPPLNSWDLATSYKSKVVLSILARETRPFWFIDVDSRVEGVPADPGTDFAGHWFKGYELQGSVLFFRPGPRVQSLVEAWDAENIAQVGKSGDQLNLLRVVHQIPGLTMANLPPEYCFIFDLSRALHGDLPGVIFRQTQASRRFKHQVTKAGFENTCRVALKVSPV